MYAVARDFVALDERSICGDLSSVMGKWYQVPACLDVSKLTGNISFSSSSMFRASDDVSVLCCYEFHGI